ncbi:MAG: M23 family metallopeptidase [Clostridia bacterium]|nr:M23 family metallopeptidase [Clostridia bacterium]
MEKKFKFSDNPTVAKAIYGAVIALLCVTAIVIGIVAANTGGTAVDTPPVINNNPGEEPPEDKPNEDEGKPTVYIAPVSGTVRTSHSSSVPVFSPTLEEWRIHTGIDIDTEEGADVFAAADGEVSAVYSDALLGKTVEITHADGVVTRYSNLASENLPKVGKTVKCGEKIAKVGDSAISEIAEDVHLHFEVLLNGTSVNPLDYLSEESKKTSLGISDDGQA